MDAKAFIAEIIAVLEPRIGGPRELDEPRPLEQLILLLLARGSNTKKARQVLKRLQTDYVDWNDVRVTPIREIAAKVNSVGDKHALQKAEQIVDLLSMIYLKFNRLNLDFLADPHGGDDAAKKKNRLFQYLSERSFAYPAMLTLHRAPKPDVIVDGGLPRILARLGLVEPKSASTAIRQRFLEFTPEADVIVAQFLLYVLSEESCHAKAPACDGCALNEMCPTGKQEVERSRDRAEAAAAAEAKAAKKQAIADKKKAAAAKAQAKSKAARPAPKVKPKARK